MTVTKRPIALRSRRDSARGADARPGRWWSGQPVPERRSEVVMTTLFHRLRRPVAGRAAATTLNPWPRCHGPGLQLARERPSQALFRRCDERAGRSCDRLGGVDVF